MVNVYSKSGKIVLRNGKVATSNSCCCKSCLCCDLDNLNIAFTGQSGSTFKYWDIFILEDCPYTGTEPSPPGGSNSAISLSAANLSFEEWTFGTQIYCGDTPDYITAVYNGNAFSIVGGIITGSATGIPIISADTPCLTNGTIDISIDGGGNATVNINPG